MNAEARNLEAIHKALAQHDSTCGFPVLAILMSPYEVERLDWPDFRGIPIKADESVPTGRFRLICEGDHSDSPAPASGQVVELPQRREAEIVEPVAI